MTKSKTHFEQVPVEIAEKVAKAESNGHSTDVRQAPTKKRSNANGVAVAEPLEDESN